jgi:tetratricopeptide (TPR) repeat protein
MNFMQRLMLPFIRTRAQKHLLYGKRKRALALFEKLFNWEPTPENRFNLALVKMNLRLYEEAIELLQAISEEYPEQHFAGITYAQSLLLAKRFPEAETEYHKLLQKHPDNALLKSMAELAKDPVGRDKFVSSLDLQFQASLLEEEHKNREALEILQKAAGLSPNDAALHNNIGALMLKLKYPLKEVMDAFSKAMQLNPDNERYRKNFRKVWQKSQK